MSGRKVLFGLTVVCLLAVVLVGLSLSQPQAAPQGERGLQRRQRGGQRMDAEQMRRMMAERLKEILEVSDEDWKVLEPRLTKVFTLSRQTSGMGGMRTLFRGRGDRDRGGRMQGREDTREQTEVGKSIEELRKLLENKEAKPEEIKKKLTALREAREKTKQELAKAQQELRKILSLRQEAQLVLMGLLN